MRNNHFDESCFVKLYNKDIPARFKVESIIDDIQGFRIILKEELCNDAVRFIVSFEDIEQYVVTPKFPDKSGDKFDPGKWSFYVNKDQDTSLIQRFHQETRQIYDDMDVTHFVIICVGNGMIEILSQSDMEITRLPGPINIPLEKQ